MFAAMFVSQSYLARALPKFHLGVLVKKSIVPVVHCFIQVISRVFEVTVMGELLNCFSNVSSVVTF